MELSEDIVGFVELSTKTGVGIADVIKKKLKEIGLSIENLRGQGYDGASNMSGKFNGVQGKILEDQPLAFYSHCSAHVLNLCVVDVCDNLLVTNAIGTVKQIINFFSDSSKRLRILKENAKDNNAQHDSLLSLCETRWLARSDAICRFLELYEVIISTLMEINTDRTSTFDPKSRSLADSLSTSFTTFRFIITLFIIKGFLSYLNSISKTLQSVQLDVIAAANEISDAIVFFQAVRSNIDDYYEEIYNDCIGLCENVDITPDNPRNCKSSPKDYYRIHCAIPLIDHIISQLKTRFDSLIQKSSKICRLLPSRICSLNHEEIDSLSTELYNIYHVD